MQAICKSVSADKKECVSKVLCESLWKLYDLSRFAGQVM